MSGVDRAQAGSLPLLRTWRSERFRLLVAIVLIIVGVRFMAGVQLPQWAYDVTVYYHAAERIESTRSPYLEMQLAAPIDALCPDCYLYPPPLAQAFAPLAAIPLDAARIIWIALQAVAMFIAVWLAAGVGGAQRSLERVVWCLAAVVWYVPVFASLWFGNVSTSLALCVTLVAIGGLAAGVGAAVGGLLKVAPVTLIPAVLAMGQSARRSFVVSVALIVGVSLLISPEAWIQYPTVLVNMIQGSADDARSYGPATVATQMGYAPWVVTLVRLATFVVALACMVGSVWAARKTSGPPLAVLLATIAMLLIPGTLWYHYFAVLLPFAAMAWPGSAFGVRVGLLTGALFVSVGPGTPILVLTGALLLAIIAGRALRPSALAGRVLAQRGLPDVVGLA